MQTIATSVIILFALIFVGYFAGKIGWLRKESAPDLSALVLNITMPVTIFLSIVSQAGSGSMGRDFLIIPFIAIFHIASIFFGLLVTRLFRVPKEKRGTWMFNCVFSNNGFMGLPLALSVFGDRGLFIMVLGNMISNLLLFSIGTKMLTENVPNADKISVKKMFLTNINFAVVAGLIFALFHIPLFDIASNLLGYLGDISSGLSMLVVGLSLSRMSISVVFKDKRMFILTAVRLLAIPLLTIAVLRILPFEMDPMIESILIMSAALPSAAAQSMIAEQYHGDLEASGQAVFLTTLFAVVTVPIMMSIGLR